MTKFQPGQSGNPAGRPKGSRSKLSEAFISDLSADWREHGAAVIARVRDEDPATYLRICAGLVPKQLEIDAPRSIFDDWSAAETAAFREALRAEMDRRTALADAGRGEDAGQPTPPGKPH